MTSTEGQWKYIAESVRFAEQIRQSPLTRDGGRFSDSFQKMVDSVDRFYDSFESPSNPPLAVRRRIALKFLDDLPQARAVLKSLGYDSILGCWYFNYAGMLHGVEPDGYIHT